jgi:putative FmdB family regulatory protein
MVGKMPKYDYECAGEEVVMELTLPIDHEQPRCSTCGSYLKRVFNAPAVHFKGKGFYKTDNR